MDGVPGWSRGCLRGARLQQPQVASACLVLWLLLVSLPCPEPGCSAAGGAQDPGGTSEVFLPAAQLDGCCTLPRQQEGDLLEKGLPSPNSQQSCEQRARCCCHLLALVLGSWLMAVSGSFQGSPSLWRSLRCPERCLAAAWVSAVQLCRTGCWGWGLQSRSGTVLLWGRAVRAWSSFSITRRACPRACRPPGLERGCLWRLHAGPGAGLRPP